MAQDTTWKLRTRQGGARSSAHDRGQPESGAADQDQGRACALERARREEATLSLLDHSFGDGKAILGKPRWMQSSAHVLREE